MAKSFELPHFRRSRCVSINACGSIGTEDKQLLKLLGTERKTLVATYPPAKADIFLALIIGGNPEGIKPDKHFHIDVLKKGIFKRGKPPEINSSIDEIEKYFELFDGSEIEASVLGRFEIPVSEIPEEGLIRSNIFETEEDNIRIQTSGAEYQIEGAPISRVSWRTNPKGNKMFIELESYIQTTISKRYIKGLYEIMNEFFRVFVLEER